MLVQPNKNAAGNFGYDLTLLSTTGRTVARVHAAIRSFSLGNPSSVVVMHLDVSASRTRAYYLDGDRDVRYLAADGTTGLVTHVPGSLTTYAAFAVSPDDRQIAVSVFDFSKDPVTVRLYIENVDGSGHVDLFTSSTDYVWPVGWHAGELVLAASGGVLFAIAGNPYGAPAYHVVDPGTAVRVATIGGDPGSGCAPSGPLTGAGTACLGRTTNGDFFISTLDWSGHQGGHLQNSGGSSALSPDGSQLAVCCDSEGHVRVLVPGGTTLSTSLSGSDYGMCWLDSDHLYEPGIPSVGAATPGQLLDLRKNADDPQGALTLTEAIGYCAGSLPQDFG